MTDDEDHLPRRIQADLTAAMKARDRARVTVLRTTLAAVANAEAPPLGPGADPVVGRLVDHPRLRLSDDDVRAIVRREIDERAAAVDDYAKAAEHDRAAVLQDEIAVLRTYLE